MPRNQFQSFSLSVEASGGELLRLEDVNAVSSRLVTFVFKQAPRPTSAPSSSIGPGRSSSSHASASHDPLMVSQTFRRDLKAKLDADGLSFSRARWICALEQNWRIRRRTR